jgi:hypothetical protein
MIDFPSAMEVLSCVSIRVCSHKAREREGDQETPGAYIKNIDLLDLLDLILFAPCEA